MEYFIQQPGEVNDFLREAGTEGDVFGGYYKIEKILRMFFKNVSRGVTEKSKGGRLQTRNGKEKYILLNKD